MMIKLTSAGNAMMELWLNTTAISSVFQPNEEERDIGIGAKVYITGEDLPWLVAESVREVVNLIEGAEK
jgi:hypothetical protein